MSSLQYINLRSATYSTASSYLSQFRANPIEEISEVAQLKCLPFFRALILSGTMILIVCAVMFNLFIVECPVCETDEYRLEVLIAIRTLERLDKDPYEQDERQDAEEVQ